MFDESLQVAWPKRKNHQDLCQRLSLSQCHSQTEKKKLPTDCSLSISNDNQINEATKMEITKSVRDDSVSAPNNNNLSKAQFRVKSINELINATELLQNSKCLKVNTETNENAFTDIDHILDKQIDDQVIYLSSSDDELVQIIPTSKKKIKAKRKVSKLQTPEKKLKLEDTEEKPSTRRKLIRSNNLKRISAKDHPESQTKLDRFFTRTPSDSIKYFQTFKSSKKPSLDENEINKDVASLLEIIMNDVQSDTVSKLNSTSKLSEINNTQKTLQTQPGNKKFKEMASSSHSSDSTSKYFETKIKPNRICEKVQNYLKENIPEPVSKIKTEPGDDTTNIKCESQVLLQKSRKCISKTSDSTVYSLSENAKIYFESEDNLRDPTESSDNVNKNDTPNMSKRNARKRLIYQSTPSTSVSSISIKIAAPDDNKKTSCSNTNQSNLSISKNCKSTISTNTSCTENFKYNTGEFPIVIDDDDENELNDDQLSSKKSKFSKSKSNRKVTTAAKELKNTTQIKRQIQCPTYKVVGGTTFAVDGFRFGMIEGVTHYFLTHFHGDHYIGLKKSFAMPIYMSEITAKLVESFIRVSPEWLNVIPMNEAVTIDGIEVTAIDANHCPGAVMFAFKFPNGNCTLHTGDFRASYEMESEPYFWNNKIDTIYLDTTYLNKNYDFKPQTDSIADVINYVTEFQEKHIGKRILIVCGSYVIGKEKVWKAVAEQTGYRVYTSGNRKKALRAISDPELIKYLIDDPKEANIHVATMFEVSYLKLYDYLQAYIDHFDVVLGIRPSGWEKNSKPQLGGLVNVVGIEYSEHSSFAEMRRFVRYLQPASIISTVPTNNHDVCRTAKIPHDWWNNDLGARKQAYQPTIRSFVTSTAKKKTNKKDNNNDNNQKSTCSKYIISQLHDDKSDIGMMDATKSSLDNTSPIKNKVATDKISECIRSVDDDWMS